MRYTARLMPATGPTGTVTTHAVAGLVGQHPGGSAGGLVLAAWIEDGWVHVDVEVDP